MVLRVLYVYYIIAKTNNDKIEYSTLGTITTSTMSTVLRVPHSGIIFVNINPSSSTGAYVTFHVNSPSTGVDVTYAGGTHCGTRALVPGLSLEAQSGLKIDSIAGASQVVVLYFRLPHYN